MVAGMALGVVFFDFMNIGKLCTVIKTIYCIRNIGSFSDRPVMLELN